MNLSVIIPSKTASNLLPCIGAVLSNEPGIKIHVVDDGLPLGLHIDADPPIIATRVHEPFIFARNVNIGINAVGEDDCVILNDDALLQTPGGFTLLQRAAQEHPEYGVIAASCNNVGNRNQNPSGIGLREDPRMICFVAVLIPRRTINLVGLLDERFTCYSHQDDDYCLRVRKAGLKIGIHDGCYVDHASLPSTFRGPGGPGGELATGNRIFKEKWGMDNAGKSRVNRLMIGPGKDKREGWLTLDVDPTVVPDFLALIPPLPAEVKAIRWDEIEWVPRHHELVPMAGSGGTEGTQGDDGARGKAGLLEQPDARLAAEGFLRNNDLVRWLFGDPQGSDPFVMNRWAYTPESLTEALIEAGFQTVVRRPAEHHYPARDFRLEAIA